MPASGAHVYTRQEPILLQRTAAEADEMANPRRNSVRSRAGREGQRHQATAGPVTYSDGDAGRYGVQAEGWYRDPYLVHGDRWFSAGQATNLVRDGEIEGDDPPPACPPKTRLVEVPHSEPGDGADLRRADDPSAGRTFDLRTAMRYGPVHILRWTSFMPPIAEPPLEESPSWLDGSGSPKARARRHHEHQRE
jgi:hypothetical protein